MKLPSTNKTSLKLEKLCIICNLNQKYVCVCLKLFYSDSLVQGTEMYLKKLKSRKAS